MQYTPDQLRLFAHTGLVPRPPGARPRRRWRRRRQRQPPAQTVPLRQHQLTPHEYLELEFVVSEPVQR